MAGGVVRLGQECVAAVGDGRRVPGEGVWTGRIGSLPHVVHVEFHLRSSDIVGRGGCRNNRAGNSLSVLRGCNGAGRGRRVSRRILHVNRNGWGEDVVESSIEGNGLQQMTAVG